MDGSVSTTAPAPVSPAPPAPSDSSPAAPPTAEAKPAAKRKESGDRGSLKKRIREEAATPTVELSAEPASEAKARPDTIQKDESSSKWTEDPTSWAEPARKAYEGLQEQHRAELGKWEEVGRKAVEQNRRLLEEVKFLREQIQNAGVQVDPRDLELLNYRSRDVSAQQMTELQQQRDAYYQQQQQQQEHAQIRREAEAAVAQMQQLAKNKGVDIRSIYSEYKAANAIGENINFEEAAARVLERLEWKQRKINAAAPAPTVSGISAGTTLPKSRSREGRLNRLRALGHGV